MRVTGIDVKKCNNCQACMSDCPANLFSLDEKNKAVQHQDPNHWCIGCGHCMACCPNDAIVYDLESNRESREFTKNFSPHNFRYVLDFLCSKRSIRNFSKQDVSDCDIADIVNAMRHAPSGHNIQACEFYVIRNRKIIRFLQLLTIKYLRFVKKLIALRYFFKPFLNRHMYDILSDPGTSEGISTLIEEYRSGIDVIFHSAPVIILVSYPNFGRMSLTDPVIATTYGMLAAHGKGLGSCWMGFTMDAVIKSKKARDLLGIEKDRLIGSVFTLGYPKTKYYRVPPRKEAQITTL